MKESAVVVCDSCIFLRFFGRVKTFVNKPNNPVFRQKKSAIINAMMTDELIKAGEAIMDSVSRAVGDGNYKRLGQELENVISDTIEAVTLDAANAAHNFNAKRRVQRPARPPFFTKLVDRDFGHEKRTGGMIGTVACTTLALANLLLWNPFAAIIFAVVDIPFIYTLRSGNQEKYLVKEFYRYGELIQSRTYITFQELADLAGEKKEMVIKNIRQMKLHDFLPTATIDHEETTLMLTNAVYREYMNSYLITCALPI